jgi:uncharacterized protein YbbC (DUF1343 family)/CubicO group peptidase (beta-lactamase class C family)
MRISQMGRRLGFIVLVLLHSGRWAGAADAGAPLDFGRADSLIETAIDRGHIPGAVLLVGEGDRVVYRQAYGLRSVQPRREAMTVDTVFDLASLSKPVGCATSVMLLAERGKLNLNDPVCKYLPAFAANGKDRITVEQLLLHRGGLIADNPISDFAKGPEEALRNVMNLSPVAEPGTKFIYTDVGYIVLGQLVKSISGQGLEEFTRAEIFAPLRMAETTYRPADGLQPRIAPTEQRAGRWMVGEVHDPRAHALGGVAGHAGLFGTADDLARYCRMILGGGQLDGTRILSEATVRAMTTPRAFPDGSDARTYGFDADTAYSSPRGDRFPRGTSFGHTGFTGTMFWMDPGSKSFVILLTNSVHPDGRGSVLSLRRYVSTAVAEQLLGPAPSTAVLAGIDVLKRNHFKQLQGKRVVVVTNHSGKDREGNRTVDILKNAPGVNVVRIFSPEHGLFGVLDEKVGHSVDVKTGLQVFSLYGETRRPTAEMLAGVDTLVFDIQDIGARFYTYISTLGLCMEEAAKHKVKVIVLDRPNPNTGQAVEGPVAEQKHFSFICYGPLPVSHGMTIGELAKYFNEQMKIGCDLEVVPMEGWNRTMWWDETGWAWVNPSPNIRNPTQSMLYPGIGLLETCNLSVGRGTDQPFEILGAPWVDGRRLAAALNKERIPGLRFVPITFTPTSSKFAKEECQGVYIVVTDRRYLSPVNAGVTIAWHLENLFGKDYDLDSVVRMLHNDNALTALKQANDPGKVPASWKQDLEAFKQTRQKYLIYK